MLPDSQYQSLFSYLKDHGFSEDDAYETCIRFESGMTMPADVLALVRKWNGHLSLYTTT